MAITPREVKTLTDEELQWIKSQFEKMDQDIFTRYDGTHALEIVLDYEESHRAFVNEAFLRRVVSEYARCGWLVGEHGSQDNNRILVLNDPSPCAPFDVEKLAEQASKTTEDTAIEDAIEEAPETSVADIIAEEEEENHKQADIEDDLSWKEAVNGHAATAGEDHGQTVTLEGEPGLEEEVETLWSTDDETEEITSAEDVNAAAPSVNEAGVD